MKNTKKPDSAIIYILKRLGLMVLIPLLTVGIFWLMLFLVNDLISQIRIDLIRIILGLVVSLGLSALAIVVAVIGIFLLVAQKELHRTDKLLEATYELSFDRIDFPARAMDRLIDKGYRRIDKRIKEQGMSFEFGFLYKIDEDSYDDPLITSFIFVQGISTKEQLFVLSDGLAVTDMGIFPMDKKSITQQVICLYADQFEEKFKNDAVTQNHDHAHGASITVTFELRSARMNFLDADKKSSILYRELTELIKEIFR